MKDKIEEFREVEIEIFLLYLLQFKTQQRDYSIEFFYHEYQRLWYYIGQSPALVGASDADVYDPNDNQYSWEYTFLCRAQQFLAFRLLFRVLLLFILLLFFNHYLDLIYESPI